MNFLPSSSEPAASYEFDRVNFLLVWILLWGLGVDGLSQAANSI